VIAAVAAIPSLLAQSLGSSVTSSSATICWQSIAATQIRVYLLADPQGGKTLLATLPGNVTSYTATGLAPAVSLFLEMDADTGSGTVSQTWFVRTLGGPRAVLDNAVREVHAYAPNILMVVLADYMMTTAASGADGAAWQAGPWKVTRGSGAPIHVNSVSRESIPVGATDYQVGYGLTTYRDDILDVDHRIYLTLAENIGNLEMLSITGPSGVSFALPFSDRYLETPAIHLNQVGYNPRAAQRYAYFSGWMGDGGALPLANFPATADVLATNADGSAPAVIATLPVTVRSVLDAEANSEVRQIDLSSIPAAEGRALRVRLPGIGVSWPTAISQASAFQAFYTVTRGLFLNRWGGNLLPQLTPWSRPPDDHQVYTGEMADSDLSQTEFYPKNTPLTGARQVTAGYHDAGDFEQRPMSTVVPQLLMRAVELSPQSFVDKQLNIPESGNGIPDLLDEALWGVSFWEQMQESDGGVRAGLQSYQFPLGFYLASDDQLPYWTFSRDANTTARVAGVFAQASRLVSAYDAARAADLRQRAVMAWNYATANGASPPYRLYAAGELYRLTQDPAYEAAFETAWNAMGKNGAFSNFATAQLLESDYQSGTRAMPDYLQSYLQGLAPSSAITAAANAGFSQFAGVAVSMTANEHAYRNARPESYPVDWGQGTSVVRFLDTVMARMQLGGLTASVQQQYTDALSLAADYVLGGNPNGLVYITGLGSRNVQEPLHQDSLVFIKEGYGPMPGIPVFGPAESAPAEPYELPAVAAFYPGFSQRPEALRYADVHTVPIFNEFSVWEMQAPETELFAVLLGQPTMPTPAPPPALVNLAAAAAGIGSSQTITVTFNAPGGYQTLDVVNVLINTALDARQACYLAYSRPSNTLYIVADSGDATQISGRVMNGTGSVGNSQCTVALAGSSAAASGNTLTLVLNVSFAASFGGNKVVYAAARDLAQGNSGWQVAGVQGVPPLPAMFPNPMGMSPAAGSSPAAAISFTYQDQSSATNLQTVWALINTGLDGRGACYVAYYRPGNQLYLIPDDGDGTQAANIVLAGNNTIGNSQCTISAEGASVQTNGNTLVVTLPVTFKTGFAGFKGVWLAAQTMGAAQTSAWQALGAWAVPGQ